MVDNEFKVQFSRFLVDADEISIIIYVFINKMDWDGLNY